jgi:dienelactone hydrolase
VVVNGYSRGSEAALLLADSYPDLVHSTILYAPGDTVAEGFPNRGNAWTIRGVPVPRTAIPVTHVAGPVLTIAGGDDQVWPSAAQARRIMRRLDDAHTAAAHQSLLYPDAGHGVGTVPYLAAGTFYRGAITMGGTRRANAAARIDSWPKVLAFLAT